VSDARLRELERRWKETGSVDDEAAYLLERVRVGDLTRERLELAAYCGHEGATRAKVGEAACEVEGLFAALATSQLDLNIIAVAAAAEQRLPEWSSLSPNDLTPHRALAHIFGVWDDQLARETLSELSRSIERAAPGLPGDHPGLVAAWSAQRALEAACKAKNIRGARAAKDMATSTSRLTRLILASIPDRLPQFRATLAGRLLHARTV
jgi:hypothetical protein